MAGHELDAAATGGVGRRRRRVARMIAGAAVAAAGATTAGGMTPLAVHAGNGCNTGANLWAGGTLYGSNNDYLIDSYCQFVLEMQSDGNLVLYQYGTAIWASGTNGHTNAHVTMQTDGNLVIYSTTGTALWSSHTHGTGSSNHLTMQTDGNAVMYNSSGSWLWKSATSTNDRSCWTSNGCGQSTFLDKVLGIPPATPYHGVNGPVTPANLYALSVWNRAEGGPIGCPGANPFNTTQREPGSYSINSVGVQRYQNANGQTCQYWGIVATGQTLTNGYYGPILNVLRNPVNSSYTQCVDLARAVGSTPWGTGDFEADC